MRKFNTTYYLLFVLLIMGSFASMAQNDYGQKILGVVAITFSSLFIVQLVSFFKQKEKGDFADGMELFSMALLSGILALRIFYIRFPFVEIIFGLAGALLLVVYVRRASHSFKTAYTKNAFLAWSILSFHISIVLYTASMTVTPFFPFLAESAGGAAFVLIIIFILTNVSRKEIIYEGEKISPLKFVSRYKDRSLVLIALYLIFTAYMGLTRIGLLKFTPMNFPRVTSNL